jgi:hypothetical protein
MIKCNSRCKITVLSTYPREFRHDLLFWAFRLGGWTCITRVRLPIQLFFQARRLRAKSKEKTLIKEGL